MKKMILCCLSLVLVITLISCDEKSETENNAPVFTGVLAEVTIDLGQTWDALDGISASDEEDGDLTSDITITSLPSLEVTNGEITPESVGDYYITYSVTDADNETTEAYSTLKVMPSVSEKTLFYEVPFVEGEPDYNDFNVIFDDPAEGTHSVDKGILEISVNNHGTADNQAKLTKSNIEITSGNNYEFIIKMKASEVIKSHYIINNAEAGWNPYVGQWNMEIGTEFEEYKLEFLANENSLNAEFLLQFGGDSFDGFVNPDQFVIYVDHIEVIETPALITETIFSDDFSTNDKNVFEVSIGETAQGAYDIADESLNIDLTANGDADWHAKVFKNNIEIEAGASYEFTIRMKASETIRLHYIINNAEVGWSPYDGKWNMEVGTEYQDYTLEFMASENSINAEFLLQFGGDVFDGFTNPESWSLVIDSIVAVKQTAATVESVVFEDNFDDGEFTGWSERGVESHVADISIVDEKLNYQITSYPADNNPWDMDLFVATSYDLVEGGTYKLVFDYETINEQFYELCFEDVNLDWQIRAGYNSGTLVGSGTYEYMFVASMDITDLYIKWSLGKAADGITSNTLTIDNLVLLEITGSTETFEDHTSFEADEESVAWGVYHNEDEGASGIVYVENNQLVYQVNSFGTTDWYNKLFIPDVDLLENGLYTIEFSVSADHDTEAIFFLNPTGQWDPRISESINITTTEQTFSFTMDDKLLFDMNFELLFQLGFENNEGPTVIEFSRIVIYRQD